MVHVSAATSCRIYCLLLISSFTKENQQGSCLRRVRRIAKTSHWLLYGEKHWVWWVRCLKKMWKLHVRAHRYNHWPDTVWYICRNCPSPGLKLRSPGKSAESDHFFSRLVRKEWRKGDKILGSSQETCTVSIDIRQQTHWQTLYLKEGRESLQQTACQPNWSQENSSCYVLCISLATPHITTHAWWDHSWCGLLAHRSLECVWLWQHPNMATNNPTEHSTWLET